MALAGSRSGSEVSIGGRPQGLTVGSYPSVAALVVLLVLASYILLKPYYLLPSGLPQIGDFLLVAALPFALALPQVQQNQDMRRFFIWMMLFCCYTALVSLVWTFVLMDPRVALYPTFYAFNLCLLFIVMRIGMLHPRATLLIIAYGIVVSAVIQVLLVAVSSNARLREIAGFNNPNQLGYWSLLSLCMFWSVAGKAKVKWYVQAITALCLVYSAAASLSKGAMISIAFLCMLHFVRNPKVLLVGLLVLVPAYLVVENSTLFEHASGRLGSIGAQEDDDLSSGARGYPRIWENPEYLLLGAGEAALYRFEDSPTFTHTEIHSTLGTMLFSYGLVGSAAFGAALWYLYRLSGGLFLYVLPPFAYGLTHQGLRFSFLWLLFAVIAVVSSTSLVNAGGASSTTKTTARRR